jgi:hypothetical protein
LICGIEAEHAEEAAKLGHRLPGRRRDRVGRRGRLGRARGQQRADRLGLHRDQAHVMRDHVVQLAGDRTRSAAATLAAATSSEASARAARDAAAASAARRCRVSVPIAQAAPKMDAWMIASYGWWCPGSVWE